LAALACQSRLVHRHQISALEIARNSHAVH
jgi:hypothetical protein